MSRTIELKDDHQVSSVVQDVAQIVFDIGDPRISGPVSLESRQWHNRQSFASRIDTTSSHVIQFDHFASIFIAFVLREEFVQISNEISASARSLIKTRSVQEHFDCS